MSELRKTPIGKTIENFIIEAGVNLPASPVDVWKLGFQIIKDKKDENFLNDVLNGVKNVTVENIKAEKSLERLYKSLQVIAKATTNEKIERFKRFTINGMIYQNEISDNDYELYLNILDNLTDKEFIILSIINKIHPTILVNDQPDKYCGFQGKITLSNLDEVISKFKGDTKISMTENNLLEILKEATGLQEEINNYKLILYSKGLIELCQALEGYMILEKVSILGEKFMEFINKEKINAWFNKSRIRTNWRKYKN